jgi:hypothetical protein
MHIIRLSRAHAAMAAASRQGGRALGAPTQFGARAQLATRRELKLRPRALSVFVGSRSVPADG